MRILVISDIHGNLAAFNHMRSNVSHIPHIQTDEYRCLGDVFGYYYDPFTVWESVLDFDPDLRLGNHDVYLRSMLVDGESEIETDVNEFVAWTILLHRQMYDTFPTEKTRDRILAHLKREDVVLPRVERFDGYTLVYVHGVPFVKNGNVNDYVNYYAFPHDRECLKKSMKAALALANASGAKKNERVILFVGHTHLPMVAYLNRDDEVCFVEGEWTNATHDSPIALDAIFEDASVMMVNGGAVGYARASNSLARHVNAAHLDTNAGQLRMIALEMLGQPLTEMTTRMSNWPDCVLVSKIMEPLHTYYETKSRVTSRLQDKARFSNMARMMRESRPEELCQYWATHVRDPLIHSFVEGKPQDDRDAYIYTALDFHLRDLF